MRRVFVCLAGLLCLQVVTGVTLRAQINSYKQTDLVSDTAELAPNKDANLLNPWGICFIPGLPFWVSDNNRGLAAPYSNTGALQGTFTVAPPHGSSDPSTLRAP